MKHTFTDLSALEANRFRTHLEEKEKKDYNNLKHIIILLGFVACLMVLWLGFVLIYL